MDLGKGENGDQLFPSLPQFLFLSSKNKMPTILVIVHQKLNGAGQSLRAVPHATAGLRSLAASGGSGILHFARASWCV